MDEQVARREEGLAPLMDQFVCARIVQFWNVDLSRFQFDHNQTFAVMFMNADGTIYGRYGTRSGSDASDDISLEGLRKAMQGALQLHAKWPANRASFAGKQGGESSWKTPESLPNLRGRFESASVNQKKCIHCHNVPSGEILSLRQSRQPVPDKIVWPFPMPNLLGISLDVDERARVERVHAKSAAESVGIRKGDDIVQMDGQPILSIADVQWVLHNAVDPCKINVVVQRQGKDVQLELPVAKGWRRQGDITWRAIHWVFGDEVLGLHLKPLQAADKRKAKLPKDEPAYRIQRFVPEWYEGGNHAARSAGLRKGDVIVRIDGKMPPETMSDLLAWSVQETKPMGTVVFDVLRGKERLTVELTVK